MYVIEWDRGRIISAKLAAGISIIIIDLCNDLDIYRLHRLNVAFSMSDIQLVRYSDKSIFKMSKPLYYCKKC